MSRRTHIFGRAAIIGLAFTLAAPAPAQAFRCTRTSPEVGPSLVWGVRKVSWWLGTEVAAIGNERGREEAERAFAAWSNPDCTDIRFPLEGVRAGLLSEFIPGGLNRNVVIQPIRWPYDAAALAITTSAYDTQTGILLDVDIELNGQTFRIDVLDEPDLCSTQEDPPNDLRNTLTHEVGHLIGLAHPPASERFADATMFARAGPCETMKRSLSADDIEGVCAIYPSGQPTTPCFPPDQLGFREVGYEDGHGCRGTAGGSGAWGVILAVGLLMRRRRHS